MTRQVNFNIKHLNARKASTIYLLILVSQEILIDIKINISEVTHSNFFEKDTFFATKSQNTSNFFCSISNIMKENKNINIIEVMNLNFNKWKMILKKNIVYDDLHDVIIYNSNKNSIEIIIEWSWRETLVEMNAQDQSHFYFNIKKSDSDETTKIMIQIQDFINIYSCRFHHYLINKFSRYNFIIYRLFLILTWFNTHYELMRDFIYCSEHCASATLFSHQKSLLSALYTITVLNARTLWVCFFFIFSFFHLTFWWHHSLKLIQYAH